MEAAKVETEAAFKPAHLVTFSPTPSSKLNNRRLSSQFSKPSSPIRAGAKKKTLAWVSLQGRLVGADEATSAQAIDGGLSREEADDILMRMQQKLDELCDQMNTMKVQPQLIVDSSASKIMDFSSRRSSLASKSDSMCTDCWFCDQRRAELNDVSGNSLVNAASGDEMFKNRLSISNEAEQEERRMSDLSDWASSVTSVADLQLNNLAIEQDTYNLKRECEEKDAAIKELSSFIRSKDVVTSKRIEELEEVIRRKCTIITKLKKDLIVLEQKVVNLTRAKRRSFCGPTLDKKQLPTMSDNLLYDMDSPLSSDDSDCTSEKKQNASSIVESRVAVKASTNTPLLNSSSSSEKVSKINQNLSLAKAPSPSKKLSLQVLKSRPVSPLKEKSLNQTHSSAASPMPNKMSAGRAGVGSKTNRRRTHSGSKDVAS
uniref:Uncharacterized protein n=1 Tax=Chenopodium quinoa TaxID=63459 RepID=A0A803L1I7_CHEQI